MVSTGAVLLVGARLLDDGTLTIGTLITAVTCSQLVFQPLQELSELYGQLQSASAAMVKISARARHRARHRRPARRAAMPRIEGGIDLDAVELRLRRRARCCTSVDIHVPAGGCLALVGESGGGKSTLAKLVARFYDPRRGRGARRRRRPARRAARELPPPARRGAAGPVPVLGHDRRQHPLRAGPRRPTRRCAQTAAAVGVDRVAAPLAGGLEHEVREGGAGLSAGERQLISIARALLADPRILILDEATSNIDRPTEVLIERALDRLLRGRTSIMIAHRLATVRRADEIARRRARRRRPARHRAELLAVDGPFRRLATADPSSSAGSQAAR